MGYSWLTSVVNPEEGVVRFAMFGAMAELLVAALCVPEALDDSAQGAIWALALLLDMGGPHLLGAEGWKLVPGHFAERHGLIVIIARGESIVAIGVGAEGLEQVDDPLKAVPAVAMLGGVGVYLLAQVAWRWRNVHRFSTQRLLTAVLLAAFCRPHSRCLRS